MKKRIFLILVIAFILDICSSESSSCDSEHSSVCSFLNGTKTCCPIKDGTCCSDVDFCCPKGFRCDTPNQRCVSDDLYMPFHLRTQVLDKNFKLGKDILCPDNQTTCKETQTCCLFGDDDFGCCPLRHALCCEDKIHCCPKNYKCNPAQGKCDRIDSNSDEPSSIKWFRKQSGTKLKQNNLCPDQKSECPTGSTCCELESGDWGCCPLPNAVCCEDHLHCCPNGYTCDVKAGRCLKGELSSPLFTKTVSIKLDKNLTQKCPDQSSQCPSGTTCCQLSSGEWGCCPLPSAVCCSDHLHCCPNGYICDVKAGRCNKGELKIPFVKKFPAIKSNSNKICPGSAAQCPSETTCCQLKSGAWGCCPIPDATCCKDHEHCCPQGYTCNEKEGKCNKEGISIPFLSKIKAIPVETNENAKIVCPGGEAECPSGSTCCELESGDWGCCPIPNAVCCEDHLHCCPNGYTCDIKAGRCNKGQLSEPFYKKILAKFYPKSKTENQIEKTFPMGDYKFEISSIVCPDGCSFCPNGYTCCKMNDGSYGCCPLPNAVCCEDHLHCCPQNSHCNLKEKTCESNGKSIMSWLEKIPSKLIFNKNKPKTRNNPVLCADGVTTCDPLDTCCKMSDGSYGCCPYTDGVCCTDLSFCCPGDSVCGKKIGECLKKIYSMKEIEALAPEIKKKSDCDGTVCQDQSGQSTCCPYRNGTCCGSHGYCCPNGYNCNSKDETCQMIDPDVSKPILSAEKFDKNLNDLKSIQCNDTVHYCPDTSTCCKTQDSYGCCAIQNAVCCDDGVNCCPQGYLCAVNSTVTCEKKSIDLIQLN